MIGRLAALILLGTMCVLQTAEDPQQISLTVVDVGDNVTFECPVSDREDKFIYWNKESLGHLAQIVGSVILGKVTVSEQFKNSRFTVRKEETKIFLTIRNVTKEEEATYFCQKGATFSQTFINGTFLSVNDHNQQKHVYVKQSPKTESVQSGDSVTLQCSLQSKNKEKRVQCPGEHSVYWFRAGSEQFNPGIIYKHRNKSDEQGEKTCVYSLSKTIQDSSDAGIYYCAVATCGEILFGEGTKVERRNVSESGPELDPVVLILGVLLACCGTVIAVFIFYINQRKLCELCKGSTSASHRIGHKSTTVDLSNDQDDEAKAVKYAALDFSTRRVIKGKKKKELTQECLYSVVRVEHQNQ